jgi:DNA-binding SARP family transcriptional activator/DNA-binding beta-propeller fold protein YncE
MRYRLLGPLEVVDDGRVVHLNSTRERTLLAVFLLHLNQVVARERLIDELWGEAPPATAAQALNVYISQLRKTLARDGDDVIVTRSPGYALELDSNSVDLTRFEGLTAEAREQAQAGCLEQATRLYREALALWRGPALAGVEFESFGRHDVERLAEARVAALIDCIDCELALGRHQQVVGELERLLVEYPYSERLLGQLMLALYRAGRQAEALAKYRESRRMLAEELGLEPSVALQRLERGILNQDPALEAPGGIAYPPTPALSGYGFAAGAGEGVAKRRLLVTRRRVAIFGAAFVAIFASAILGLSGTIAGGRRTFEVVAGSLARVDGASGRLDGVTRVGTIPGPVAYAGSAVWVLDDRDGTLSKVDAKTGNVMRTVSVRGFPVGLATGEGAVWVASVADGIGLVTKIDVDSGALVSTLRLGTDAIPRAVAAGEGGIWIAAGANEGSGGVLLRLSPRTGAVGAKIPLPSKPVDLAVADRGVWVIGELRPSPTARRDRGAIYLIDVATGRIAARATAPFVAGRGRASLEVGTRGVWIAGDRGLLQIDPATARVERTIRIGGRAAAVATSGGYVWGLTTTGLLSRIAPMSGTVVTRLDLEVSAKTGRGSLRPSDLAVNGRTVWVGFAPVSELSFAAPSPTRPHTTVKIGDTRAVPIAFRGGPTRVRYAAGSVWVKDYLENAWRIDPATARITATVPVGDGWGDFAYADGSVWATSFDTNTVSRIDPATNRITARIRTKGLAPMGIAVTPGGAVWVANHHGEPGGPGDSTGSVVRIDPRTDSVVAKIPLGAKDFCCGPDNMVAAAGDVWLDIPNKSLVVRIDARKDKVAARIPVAAGCGQLAAGAGSVWVAEGCSNQIIRIDPRTNKIVARIDTGSNVYPIVFAKGSLWATTDDLRLLRIEPASDAIVDSIDISPAARTTGGGPWFAFGDGAFWFSDFTDARMLETQLGR